MEILHYLCGLWLTVKLWLHNCLALTGEVNRSDDLVTLAHVKVGDILGNRVNSQVVRPSCWNLGTWERSVFVRLWWGQLQRIAMARWDKSIFKSSVPAECFWEYYNGLTESCQNTQDITAFCVCNCYVEHYSPPSTHRGAWCDLSQIVF